MATIGDHGLTAERFPEISRADSGFLILVVCLGAGEGEAIEDFLIHCLEKFFVWWSELDLLHCEVFVKVWYVMIRFLQQKSTQKISYLSIQHVYGDLEAKILFSKLFKHFICIWFCLHYMIRLYTYTCITI